MENAKGRLAAVLDWLPARLGREIESVARGSRHSIREIRLRASGISSVVTDGGDFPLFTRVTHAELEGVVDKMCGGSIYAHRADMNDGYISVGGVRVGVVGEARYDGEGRIGVSSVASLSFRIPTGVCGFAAELYSRWLSLCGNLLIVAPPSGGKTTALRALAGLIGSGRGGRRVVVVDERCELDPAEYGAASVDILQGYRRGQGIEIAVRTMSPEVLMVDEIASAGDAKAISLAMGVGIPVIATAHGTDLLSLTRRDFIRDLLGEGLFTHICPIKRSGSGFFLAPNEAVGDILLSV